MPTVRLEGPDYTLERTTLPEQALSAMNRRFTMPNHMPQEAEERRILRLVVTEVGTTITAEWCNPGSGKFEARTRPRNVHSRSRLIFHATCNEAGTYTVYATVPRNYNCHWVLWMDHEDCIPYRYRCHWGLTNHIYKQVLYGD